MVEPAGSAEPRVTRYLTLEQVLDLADLATGGTVEVRDTGLLESAVHRPRASVFGQDAYPDIVTKAAALMHSVAVSHCLVDGNKCLAWTVTDVFCRYNDVVLDPAEEQAYELVIAVAPGELRDVDDIAAVLRSFVR